MMDNVCLLFLFKSIKINKNMGYVREKRDFFKVELIYFSHFLKISQNFETGYCALPWLDRPVEIYGNVTNQAKTASNKLKFKYK